MNEIPVQEIVTPDGHRLVTRQRLHPDGHIGLDGIETAAGERPDLLAPIEALAIANDAPVNGEGGQWRLSGEPTEGALIALALKCDFDPRTTSAGPRWAEVPFECEHKLRATLNLTPGCQQGRPERARRVA